MKRWALTAATLLTLAGCTLSSFSEPVLPPGVTQEDIDALGNLVCTSIASGSSIASVNSVWTSAGISESDAEELTRGAVADYCPEYDDRLD